MPAAEPLESDAKAFRSQRPAVTTAKFFVATSCTRAEISLSCRSTSHTPGSKGKPKTSSKAGRRRSKSTNTVRRPARARLNANCVASVVLPSPPAALETMITRHCSISALRSTRAAMPSTDSVNRTCHV